MGKQSIMCIGAHADDIEFWAGGTCLKYLDKGYKIDYVMSTNNMSGQFHIVEKDKSVTRKEGEPEIMEPVRKREAAAGASMLKAVPVHLDHPQRHYTGPDMKKVLEGYGVPSPKGATLGRPCIMVAYDDPKSVDRVKDLILERTPEAVLTHNLITLSPEHYATAMLILLGYRKAVKAGYAGPLLFWNEFVQSTELDMSFFLRDSFIDISGLRQRQFDLIRCHITMVPFPERMDYLDFTKYAGVKDAELFKFASPACDFKPSGEFTEELNRNLRMKK
jgi:LmbE family N-acetylglucosaminyl deacetylase